MTAGSPSIKNNFIYNTVYQLLALFVPLVTTPYLSRVLGAQKIGDFSFSFNIAYYFALFAMLGVNNYGNRCVAQTRDDPNLLSKTFLGIYTSQISFTVLLSIVYSIYVVFISGDKTLAWIMLGYIVSAGLDINWFFAGIEYFKLTALRNSFVKLLSVVLIFCLVKTKEDLYVYSIIYVFSNLVSQLILWFPLRKYVHYTKIKIDDIFKHIKPNLILFIPILAISLYKVMDKLMLGVIASKLEVGYYESSERIIQVPIVIVTSLGMVMLPRISNLIQNKQFERSESYFGKALLISAILSTSLGYGIMAVSKEFIPLFYGPGFEKCIPIYLVLLPSCLFLALANVVRTQKLIPNNRDHDYVVSIIIGAFVNIVLNFIFIPKFGSVGASIGTLCAEASVCIVQLFYVRNIINIKSTLKIVFPFLVSGIAMFLIVFNISFPFSLLSSLIVKIFLGIVVYTIFSIFFLLIFKLIYGSSLWSEID